MTIVPALDLRSAEPHPQHAPANIEAEQALLGALLFDNAAYERLSDQLQSRHFYEPFHQRLFAAMEEHIRKGQLAEPIMLMERFRKDPAFEELGGLRYLADLVDRAPPAAHAADYGRLVYDLALRRELIREGAICQSPSDTEVVLLLTARSRRGRIMDRFTDALSQIEGAYALVALTNKKLIGARDPLGIRPLVLGELDGCPILCSETCALDIIGARFVRDIENGEVIVVDAAGVRSLKPFPHQPMRPCIFEYVYFARPDSIVHGRSVYETRKAMGAELAKESPADADVVVPVPDSGVPAALGYAAACGVPFELGIIRNHYVGRTFIQPTQAIRELGVRLKHNANRAVVAGKRVVLIDDSIVRGTTSVKIVQMMREAGAREVHMRISSPPITHPDFYGIDTPERDKLLAARMDLEGMRRFMGADSLAFLSIDGIYRAMGYAGRDPRRPQFTDHCFTGDYPTRLTDQHGDPDRRQMSLLAEAS